MGWVLTALAVLVALVLVSSLLWALQYRSFLGQLVLGLAAMMVANGEALTMMTIDAGIIANLDAKAGATIDAKRRSVSINAAINAATVVITMTTGQMMTSQHDPELSLKPKQKQRL